MKLLHFLVALPLIVLAAWAIYCADSAEGIAFAWHFQDNDVLSWNTKLVLFVFLTYGYICGRIGAWFSAAPMRKELRQQKKANRTLVKEQDSLNKTVSGLKQNVSDLQQLAKNNELVQQQATAPKGIMAEIMQKFHAKKGL